MVVLGVMIVHPPKEFLGEWVKIPKYGPKKSIPKITSYAFLSAISAVV